jgi:hypothetical protein
MSGNEELPTIQLDAALERIVRRQLTSMIEEKGIGADATKALSESQSQDRKLSYIRNIWANNGFLRKADKFQFGSSEEAWQNRMTYGGLVDALATPDASILMPRVISQIVREAVEPQLTLTGLLRRIDFSAGTHITFPAVSAMAGVQDMAEGEPYPELIGPRFAGTVTVKMGKVGASVRVTEEVLRYSQWDVMGMLLAGAGRAMARHKEKKISTHISDNAVVSFNNDTHGGDHGQTTGRDLNGHRNNTLRLDDLFTIYADLVNDGFIPNTLLMNPLGWLIFARDPSLRAFGFANGGPLFRTVQGAGGMNPSWDPNLGVRSTSAQLSYSSQHYVDVPSLFPVPLAIVVSPHITYTAASENTDIFMCDREELGLMVVDEDPTTDSFQDPKRDIHFVKIRERFGICILNEGAGARKIQSVSVRRGYDFEDTKTVWDLQNGPLGT